MYIYIQTLIDIYIHVHIYIHMYRHDLCTGWRGCIGCLIFTGYFPHMCNIINGYFAERDPQLTVSSAPLPPSRRLSSNLCHILRDLKSSRIGTVIFWESPKIYIYIYVLFFGRSFFENSQICTDMIVVEDCFATSLTARSKESFVHSEMPCSLSFRERLKKQPSTYRHDPCRRRFRHRSHHR